MRSPELQELALLDPGEALRQHFDAQNYRRARLIWVAMLCISLAGLVAGLDSRTWPRWLAGAASLTFLLLLVPARRHEIFRRNFAVLLFALLSAEILLWTLCAADESLAIAFGTTFAPLSLLALRLRGVEQLTVGGVAVGAAALRMLVLPARDAHPAMSGGGLLAVGIVVAVGGAVGWTATTRSRQDFLLQWRQVASRERDRLRMREELQDARSVQLAMLPATPPALSGLDIAGVCVPATEVGGDYFGYFPAADGSLAVAIGDVAGHGMASGLVLAGVRAGLQLLSDDIARSPAQVLERLNGVVAGTTTPRLLMTLGLVRFDRAGGRATWVSAGHPPPLHFTAADGRCESPPTAHPPLGTRLPVQLEVVERPLGDGDVWLLVSDGVLEARNSHGREFGDGPLGRAFARLAGSESSAGAILDGLLAEHTRFRGGEPLEDDLTLVVVRAADAT